MNQKLLPLMVLTVHTSVLDLWKKLTQMVTGQDTMTKRSNINLLSNRILSVQASLNGLSFCILDTIENNILLLKDIHFEEQKNPLEIEKLLVAEFETTSLLQQEFKQVNLIHQNNICTFVPNIFYDENNLVDYLKFNNKIFESDFIATDEIVSKEIMSVYVPFVNINNFFFERFGSFEYHHASTIIVEQLLKVATPTTNKLYCNVSYTSFELISIKNGVLNFFNSFDFDTKEDFVYYVLFTIEQLQLDAEIIDLILLGDIGLDDELYSILYQYIRNISFGSRNTQFMARDIEQKPKYGYNHFSLLNTF
ncbi:MAG: DUF3822 family protein [Flavobacteriaceae bacterium]|nr:DUF3822 family protein [Flavobacteriaceae bacterium]